MAVLGLRFCEVADGSEGTAQVLRALGLEERDGVFPVGGASWVETWPASQDMPAGVMLQLVVEDADATAAEARAAGLAPQGPFEAHGEKIYFLKSPSGLSISFQSAL